jgi:hypothetical protein
VIVTSNLKDFAELPEGIEAQSPDDFLCNLLDLDREAIIGIVRGQAAAMKRPPRTFEELLDGLAKTVPDFASTIRSHLLR